jgi:hypothetical protein
MKVALVCIAKDEDDYINEWVDYHLKLGFHKIFIYENNWRCPIDFDPNLVVKIPFDGEKKQLEAYKNFMIHRKDNYDWAAFFDVDEFLVLKQHSSIPELMTFFKNENCLVVNWVLFGDNNQECVENNNYSVLSRFTRRQVGVDKHIKSIVNLKNNFTFGSPHHLVNVKWTDPSGNRGYGAFNSNGNDDVFQLNHYYCKTIEEFKKKSLRGSADLGYGKSVESFPHHNLNDIDDFNAYNFMYKSDLQKNKKMNLLQIGTNVANDHFSEFVKTIGNDQIEKLILVEPQKSCNNKINLCYAGFDFILENLVINLDESIKNETFFISKFNWLSSLKKEHIENHKTNEKPIEVDIESITLNNLFDKHSIISLDILFIDCEGMDDKIIKSINFEKYDIKKIYYEHTHIDNESLIHFLTDKGYQVLKSDFNDELTNMAIKKDK